MPATSLSALTGQPFLKWAGGKRWLVRNYSFLFDCEFERLVEPFLGSGSVFFSLQPKRALLADSNSELIRMYKAVKFDPLAVLRNLHRHNRNHSDDYYYEIRAMRPRTEAGLAARFIYLNRTCWNGLYRVNLSGQFNVPRGTKNSVLLPTDDFAGVARALRKVSLKCSDFEKIIDKSKEGDLIYADPPYTVKHNMNGFVKYNESLFSWDDQIRLRDAVKRATHRGAKVLVSNADHKCIREIYKGFGKIHRVSRPSLIAGDAKRRGTYNEVVVEC